MVKRAVELGKKLLLAERTPTKLAFACSVGIFIAFWPLIGIHWLLTIILSWVFRLNVGVIYAAAHIVNNPFTMIPIYLAGYATGLFITNTLFGVDLLPYNPSWMQWLNLKISCLGIPNLSLWAFLIGGHVLGLAIALLAYYPLLHFFRRIITHHPPVEK